MSRMKRARGRLNFKNAFTCAFGLLMQVMRSIHYFVQSFYIMTIYCIVIDAVYHV